MKGHVDVVCSICNFAQPLENRPDVMGMAGGRGGGGGYPPQQGHGPQGWGHPPQQQPHPQYR